MQATDGQGGGLFDGSATRRKARFRGGPLDGQTRMVPHHSPAWVRYWETGDPAPHWYVIAGKNVKGTYKYVGHGDHHALA
jgi:hypothetical protein